MRVRALTLILAALAAGACDDDATGPEENGEVAVRFRTASAATAAQAIVGGPAAATIVGSNGTLEIESIHMVVGKFKLEGSDEACPDFDDDEGELDDCGDFESAPFLFDLPLDGEVVTVVTADVPAGSYDELEFEVEDVDLDDDDDEEEELADLLVELRALHADWPDGASAVVTGTFTPVGEAPRAFRTFIDAEVEIELDLAPALTVSEDGSAAVTVVLDPSVWFRTGAGGVIDLSAFDGVDDDDLLELEIELENGFVEVEVDED